ncbi:hypothetical protein C4657_12340 [Salmonella enterica subsp. enterica serovar Infantis]|nr:hypothetical protein C4657_12340 [Salmonella enterica subsp. enterica serovar Infantis]
MLTEKYDFRITDQMTIPLRPHWIANDSYREKCKMLVLNRSKGEIHKVDFSKVTDYIKEGDVIMKAYASEDIQSCQFDMFGDCMLIIQDEGQG